MISTFKSKFYDFFPITVPDLPSPPKNVSYYFILSEQNITAQFRWLPPSSSLHPITGYNIIWAEPRPVPPNLHGDQGFPILNMETRHSKRLRHVSMQRGFFLFVSPLAYLQRCVFIQRRFLTLPRTPCGSPNYVIVSHVSRISTNTSL